MYDNSILYLAVSLLIIGAITTYFKVKKDSKLPKIEYKASKTKGYDYKNPTRFFCEPLMRYIWTPMALCIGSLVIFAIISVVIFGDDGGKGLMKVIGVDTANWIIGGVFVIGLAFLIAYSFLYFIRDWGNKEKWNMRYEDGVKKT